MMDYVWFLFRFEGRINRAKYWLAGLIVGCWILFLAIVVVGIAKMFGGAPLRSAENRQYLRRCR